MGFEPQTSNLPLVNPRKRTTKVNLVIIVGVVLFLIIGLFYALHTLRHEDNTEPPAPTTAPGM